MTSESAPAKRVIKRYSNRKLYDTQDSRYVTLQQIGEMVRNGEDVQIIDNKTKQDKTEVTLALILSEDLRSAPAAGARGTLRTLIQERSERLLTSLREGPIGRLLPGTDKPAEADTPAPPEAAAAEKAPKSRLDELVAALGLSLGGSAKQTPDELRAELAALAKRVEAIEAHLGLPSPRMDGDKS